jgi:hypothetical protein
LLVQPGFNTPILDTQQFGNFLSVFLRNSIILSSYTIFFDLIFAVAGFLTLLGVRQYLIKENYETQRILFFAVLCILRNHVNSTF